MAKAKKIKYLFDGVRGKDYVRCWADKNEMIVQVWLNKTSPDGEPEGDWAYSKLFGPAASISQGVLDTQADAERGNNK